MAAITNDTYLTHRGFLKEALKRTGQSRTEQAAATKQVYDLFHEIDHIAEQNGTFSGVGHHAFRGEPVEITYSRQPNGGREMRILAAHLELFGPAPEAGKASKPTKGAATIVAKKDAQEKPLTLKRRDELGSEWLTYLDLVAGIKTHFALSDPSSAVGAPSRVNQALTKLCDRFQCPGEEYETVNGMQCRKYRSTNQNVNAAIHESDRVKFYEFAATIRDTRTFRRDPQGPSYGSER